MFHQRQTGTTKGGEHLGRQAAFKKKIKKMEKSISSWKELWLGWSVSAWQLHEWCERRCASADNLSASIKTGALQKNSPTEEIITRARSRNCKKKNKTVKMADAPPEVGQGPARRIFPSFVPLNSRN